MRGVRGGEITLSIAVAVHEFIGVSLAAWRLPSLHKLLDAPLENKKTPTLRLYKCLSNDVLVVHLDVWCVSLSQTKYIMRGETTGGPHVGKGW